MKNKRWLFILLFFLFLINIAFFIVTRFTNYELWLKTFLVEYLEENFELQTTVEGLSISDKHIKLNGIELSNKDKDLSVRVEHVYVNYNLFHAIFSRTKMFKVVESVTIVEPSVDLKIDGTMRDSTKETSFEIPENIDYFQSLHISKGIVSIEYSDEQIEYRDIFEQIDLKVETGRQVVAKLMLNKGDTEEDGVKLGETELLVEIADGEIKRAEYNIHRYSPDTLQLKGIDNTDFELELVGIYDKGLIQLNGSLKGLESSFYDRDITVPYVEFLLYDDRLFFRTEGASIDESRIELEAEIEDLFKTRKLVCTAVVERIPLEYYLPDIISDVSVIAKVSGTLSEPRIDATIGTKRLHYKDEKVDNIAILAEYYDKKVDFKLENALWRGNELQGVGNYYPDSGVTVQINQLDLIFVGDKFDVSGDLEATLSYYKDLEITAQIENFMFMSDNITLQNFNVQGNLFKEQLSVAFDGHRVKGELSGDISTWQGELSVDLFEYNLNSNFEANYVYLKAYPHLTGKLKLSYFDDLLSTDVDLSLTNPLYGELEGGVKSGFTLDLQNDRSDFKLATRGFKYRGEPASVSIKAKGTAERLKSTEFTINDDLAGDLWIDRASELSFGFSLFGEGLRVERYLRYLIEEYDAQKFDGTINCSFTLDYPNNFRGKIDFADLTYNKLGYIDGSAGLSYDRTADSKMLYKSDFSKEGQPLFSLQGVSELDKQFDTAIRGEVSSLDLHSIFPELDLFGQIDSELVYLRKDNENKTIVDFKVTDFRYKKSTFDNLGLSFTQQDSLFILDRFEVSQKNLFHAQAAGELGLNLLTDRFYPSDKQIHFSFEGDVIKVLADNFKYLEDGSSKAKIDISFGIQEEELNVESAQLTIENGTLKVTGQAKLLEKISLDMVIKDNQMTIKQLVGELGEGKIIIRNEILDDENDFMLGMVNLGQLYCRTTPDGVTLSIPTFFPPGVAGNVIVRGRHGPEALVKGPFDDVKVQADLHLSNASVTYPANTENLFKIINLARAKKKKSSNNYYPVSLDLRLIAENQVRYVTYPVNLLLLPKSYIHILYQNDEWDVVDAFFSSEKGSLDMFGSTFSLDYGNFTINEEIQEYRLNGSFIKYAADGSLISLDVFNDPMSGSENFLEKIQFELTSDNPEDRTTLHILSKLRYNRRLEDIPRAQQNALLGDEFMQLAGIGLAGALVDPIIYPLENHLRQLLRLDFFAIRPSFVENIVRTYGSLDNTAEQVEENEIIQFSKNIILNNFSVTLGKFIARDLFLDYELLLQKPVDVLSDRDILLYNNFTFNYNLPFKLRFAYRFYLTPEEEPNSHEVFLRRSFSFW
ncbi:MAG: hypothetical protein WC327_02695 [Candidatus Cloacimonadia bacterium]